jgi:hypothetical protein
MIYLPLEISGEKCYIISSGLALSIELIYGLTDTPLCESRAAFPFYKIEYLPNCAIIFLAGSSS